MKKIFISYSWEDSEYTSRVMAFANHLSNHHYEVIIDRAVLLEEPSEELRMMMYKGIALADKVIVLLSPLYKAKTLNEMSGVYFEFSLILADMVHARNKYILASLNNFTDVAEIAPLPFQNRFIYNLSNDMNYTLLYSILEGRNQYQLKKGHEALQISDEYRNDIYHTFLSDSENCYFNYLGRAGEAYAAITRENVRLGEWEPAKGLDNTAIYYIAEAIKQRYDNQWTSSKSVEEVAYDITEQISAYLIWKASMGMH